MKLRDLIQNNRSYRRFYQEKIIDRSVLEELVDLARLSASAGNRQPLKYFLANDTDTNARIFPHLSWAGYLKNWPGPAEGERPAAYLVILGDTAVATSFDCDHGIAAQSILLGATEKGLGGCMIGAVQREPLAAAIGISSQYKVLLVIALGVPRETVRLVSVPDSGSIEYWRDSAGIHYVPKRELPELLIN
jgi:nitroreductase